jgi:hypothetical protein
MPAFIHLINYIDFSKEESNIFTVSVLIYY